MISNKGFLILAGIVLLMTGCGEKEESVTYVKNEKLLTYDELLLWATDLAADLAGQEFETSKINKEGMVERDYGYASVTYLDGTIPKIAELTMTRPNLACPRGVFLGNPSEKIESYYHAVGDEYGQGLNYYYEDQKNTTEKYAYGWQDDGRIELGAASGNADGSFTWLRLEYFIENDETVSIVYTADFKKEEKDMYSILVQAEDRVKKD